MNDVQIERVSEDPGDVWLLPGFLSDDDAEHLLAWLEDVPIRGVPDPGTFAFTHPVYDGEPIPRREAFAGDPVWLDEAPGRGPAMPRELTELMARAQSALATAVGQAATGPATILSSVYVDRYDTGIGFVPHADRDFYGEHIVGVSVGPGVCSLRFTSLADHDATIDVFVPSGSLYVFAGVLRRMPWVHEVKDVTAVRYSITYRGAAG